MKLLLHVCCAPCSIKCVDVLSADGILSDLFWFNPNIHPFTEYRARLDTLEHFAEVKKLSLVVEGEYALRFFINTVETGKIATAAERCAFCYRLRLEKTASMAAERGYDAFSTTLLISPYQNHELIKQIAEEMAVFYGCKFHYQDFRSFFRDGQNHARAAGFHMQKYCGCIYSEEERYNTSKGSDAPGGNVISSGKRK